MEVNTEDGGKKWNLSHLDKEKREKLEKVLLKVEDMFSADKTDRGETKELKMPLYLVDDVQVNAAYRKIPTLRSATIWKIYTKMAGFVSPTHSTARMGRCAYVLIIVPYILEPLKDRPKIIDAWPCHH